MHNLGEAYFTDILERERVVFGFGLDQDLTLLSRQDASPVAVNYRLGN